MSYKTSIYIGDPRGEEGGGERVAGGDRARVCSQSIQLQAVDTYS